MPTYTVQITLNVPGVGSKAFAATGIVASDPQAAMVAAIAQVPIRVTALSETAP